jgi:hypothetical protein
MTTYSRYDCRAISLFIGEFIQEIVVDLQKSKKKLLAIDDSIEDEIVIVDHLYNQYSDTASVIIYLGNHCNIEELKQRLISDSRGYLTKCTITTSENNCHEIVICNASNFFETFHSVVVAAKKRSPVIHLFYLLLIILVFVFHHDISYSIRSCTW